MYSVHIVSWRFTVPVVRYRLSKVWLVQHSLAFFGHHFKSITVLAYIVVNYFNGYTIYPVHHLSFLSVLISNVRLMFTCLTCAKKYIINLRAFLHAPPWKKRFVYKSLLESETSSFPNTNNLIVIYLPEPVNRLKNQSAGLPMVFLNTPIVFDHQKLFSFIRVHKGQSFWPCMQ